MADRKERTAALGAIGAVLAAVQYFGPFLYPYGLGPGWSPAAQLWFFSVQLLWVAAMLVTYWRDPAGRMWKLFLALQLVGAVGVVWILPTSLTWTLSQLLVGFGSVVFVHLVLAFPSGRLGDRYDRILVATAYGFVGVSRVAWLLVWEPPFQKDAFSPTNPYVIWPNDELAWLFGPGAIVVMAPFLFGAVPVGLWRHWRRASPATRRALLPVIVAAPLQLALTVAWHVADANPEQWGAVREALQHPLAGLAGIVFPVGFLIGLLRARLARAGIGDLAVELGRGVPLGGLRDTLARALCDPTLVLAFPAPSGDGFVDPDGQSLALPAPTDATRRVARLERDGETLAVLVYDPAIEGEDPGRVDAVGSMARLALENERLSAQVRAQLEEVRASRVRIVEAADAERRRIERDLHDGAQQRLLALAMRLDQARAGSSDAAAIIEATTAELLTAVREVRDLARGLHPTILTDSGLSAAVDALAERTPFPVATEVTQERFPALVELAAYFTIAEGLTNIARYARATEARVAAAVQDGRLVVTVSDNGQGGADPAGGSGLRGLADRLAAVGGELHVASSLGEGTTLTATLPTQP
ncbi:MAG: sensor histidine kinase [Chloroflexi bacterium]|nr:sensor histidine kinase [Chloroflexota bacterium]